jgi:hypothetical protein
VGTACVFLLQGPSSQAYWAAMLALQALPYGAALVCTWLSMRPARMAGNALEVGESGRLV